jgi:pimeloyl-ACP methyl ester carboxylesterase
MSVILLDQEIVHYEVLGRGKPIIFLHGWVGSWRYWIPAMQACSVSCRAYALDLWGFGDTTKNLRHYPLIDQVLLVEKFLDRMGIGKVAFVGHGLGALVSMVYCMHHPNQVDRQMLISYTWDPGKLNPRLSTQSPAELAEWVLGKFSESEPVRIDAPRTDPNAIRVSLTGLISPDLVNARKILRVPSLFVYGQNDPILSAPDVEEDLRLLPENMHTIVFERSGHFPMLDETSKWHRLLADFLALPADESPRELQLKEEWKRRVR